MSGPKRISVSSPCSRADVLDDLTRRSRRCSSSRSRALTSAVVLTYMTTIAPGVLGLPGRAARSAVIESASEQPASRSGIRTVLSGQRIEAVSAMKWTPQKAITALSTAAAALREPERVADVVGHVLDLGHLVVVGEDDRVALARRARGPPPGAPGCRWARACRPSEGRSRRSWQRLQLQREVQGGGRVRERPDRDELYARRRDVPDRRRA